MEKPLNPNPPQQQEEQEKGEELHSNSVFLYSLKEVNAVLLDNACLEKTKQMLLSKLKLKSSEELLEELVKDYHNDIKVMVKDKLLRCRCTT